MLKPGDFGDVVKALQRNLNKLGSLLLVDGDFGPGTTAAVLDARVTLKRPGSSEVDDALANALAAHPDPFPPLTAAGVTFIGREEVSSPAMYRRLYCRPTWPGGESGITIGIGYDLRFIDEPGLRADWGAALSDSFVARLRSVLHVQGSAALAAECQDVELPLNAAIAAFIARGLPHALADVRKIYSQVDTLSPARRTALVSLVYNRGNALVDLHPEREDRREMREIKRLLEQGNHDAVAEQLDSMARLWSPPSGLVARRHREATLWRAGFAALQLE